MISEINPHISEDDGGGLNCEWIAGQQGGPQVRFALAVEANGEISWYMVGGHLWSNPDGPINIAAAGYLPDVMRQRICAVCCEGGDNGTTDGG